MTLVKLEKMDGHEAFSTETQVGSNDPTPDVPKDVRIPVMAKQRPRPDDDTEELITIPGFGRVGGGLFSRIGNLGIGFAILFIVAVFVGATGVWAAGHIGEPLIKAEVEAKERLTAATIEKDKAITETQRQLTAVISQLVQTVESQRVETNRKEAVDRESWKTMSSSLQSIQLSLQELVASDHKRNRGNN
jgi:hypothetical protein